MAVETWSCVHCTNFSSNEKSVEVPDCECWLSLT